MRRTKSFKRTRLPLDTVKRIIDSAAAQEVQAISFTGGEPLLFLDDLCEMIVHAGNSGIRFIRTGTNGFIFRHSEKDTFLSRIETVAEKLARTPLRNLWISIDSADAAVHESMRGLDGVINGLEKGLPIFHGHGIYPSANLGLNRNIGGNATAALDEKNFSDSEDYLSAFDMVFRDGLTRFFRFVESIGFTMASCCYPMSVEEEAGDGLKPVYGASATDRIIRFGAREKAVLFKGLLRVISVFKNRIRIFTPRCALYAISEYYRNHDANCCYPCRGGIDYFFVDSRTAGTYPCGYRGRENLGSFWTLNLKSLSESTACLRCDWECFRDPSELFGPFVQGISDPIGLLEKFSAEPEFFRLWHQDLRYCLAWDFFDGRKPMRPKGC